MTDDVDISAATATAVGQGVWLRPFRDLVYTMPSYPMEKDDVARVCDAVVAAACAARRKEERSLRQA